MKKLLSLTLALAMTLSLAMPVVAEGLPEDTAAQQEVVQEVADDAPVETPEPTEPTEPTETAEPTEQPTEAPTAEPVETPTETPTETAKPVETPTEELPTENGNANQYNDNVYDNIGMKWYYTIDVNQNCTISQADKNIEGDIVIPSEIAGCPVTQIAAYTFYNCDKLTGVTIPDTVTDIGDYAFAFCDNLQTIALSKNLESIGNSGFVYSPKLERVELPDTLTSLGEDIFRGTALQQIEIPANLTNIAGYAFYSCDQLTSVTFKAGATEVYKNMFMYCNNLVNVTLPDTIQSIDEGAFSGTGIQNIDLPEDLTFIGDDAFAQCNALENVEIPEKVSNIGSGAFFRTNIEKIVIPKSVTSLGDRAFEECKNLTDVTLACESIGDRAFYSCSKLKTVTLQTGVKSIGEAAFSFCSVLDSIIIPHGVKEVGDYAFEACSMLQTAKIPGTVKQIGVSAFDSCGKLANVTIDNGVQEIGAYAFCACSILDSVSIPDSVKTIGESAFENCQALTNVTLPQGLAEINDRTFYYCLNLSKIKIPSSVTRIGKHAFYYTRKLVSIKLPALETLEESVFSWSGLQNITIPAGVTTIENNAFQGCRLKTITLPLSLKKIDSFNGLAKDIYYAGSEADKSKIEITSGNTYDGATWHYNSNEPDTLQTPGSGVFGHYRGQTIGNKDNVAVLIYDSEGTPIKNASVTVDDKTIKTDKDGKADIAYPMLGHLKMTVAAKGYYTVETTRVVQREGCTVVTLVKQKKEPYLCTSVWVDDEYDVLSNQMIVEKSSKDETENSIYANFQYANDAAPIESIKLIESNGGSEKAIAEGQYGEPLKIRLAMNCEAGSDYYVVAFDANDTEVKRVQVQISVLKVEDSLITVGGGFNTSINCGSDITITPGEQIPIIGGASFNVSKVWNIPVRIEMGKNNKDTLIPDRVAVYIGDSFNILKNLSLDGKEVSNLKESEILEILKESVSDPDANNKMGKPTTLLNTSASIQVCGYGEIKNVSDSGTLVINATTYIYVTVQGGRSYYLPVSVPIYVKLNAIGKGDVKSDFTFYISNGEVINGPVDAKLEIKPSFSAGAGLGYADVLDASVSGKGTFNYLGTLNAQGVNNRLTFTASVVVEAHALIFSYYNEYFAQELVLLGSKEKTQSNDWNETIAKTYDASSYTLMDRSYLNNVAAQSVEAGQVQAGVYPNAEPQIIEYANKKYLFYLDDAAERGDADRTVLCYRVSNGSGWSDPIRVQDDGTGDYNFALLSAQDGLYVLWQNAKQKFGAECDSLQTMQKAIGLTAAKVTDTGVEKTWNIDSTDGVAPGSVSLAMDGEKVTAVWTENSTNALDGAGTNTIYEQQLGGTRTICAVREAPVTTMRAGTLDGKFSIAWTEDSDADMSTTADREIWLYSNGTTSRLTSNDVIDSNPQFLPLNNGELVWYSNNNFMELKTANGVATVILPEGSGNFSDTYQVSANNGKAVVLLRDSYTVGENSNNALYAMTYDGSAWSQPVLAMMTEKQIGSADVLYSADGTTSLTYTLTQGNMSTLFAGAVQYPGMVQITGLKVDENEYSPNQELPVKLQLTNQGQGTGDVILHIVDENGSVSWQQDVGTLNANEVKGIELANVVLPAGDYDLEVLTNNLLTDKTTISLGNTNLNVEGNTYYSNGEELADVQVSNLSNIPSGATVAVAVEDEPEKVLFTDKIESLGAKETQSYVLNLTKMFEEVSRNQNLIFTVTADESETDLLTNSTLFYNKSQLKELPLVKLNKTEMTLHQGGSAKLITETTGSADTVTWYSACEDVAKVDANGRVIAVAPGVATITCQYGNAYASCMVTVTDEETDAITSDSYTIDEDAGTLTGFAPGTTPAQIRANLNDQSVTFEKVNGEEAPGDKPIGTGCTVTNGNQTLTLLLYGDVDGDGAIKMMDLVAIRKHIMKVKLLEGLYLRAAAPSNPDAETPNPSIRDMVRVRKYVMHVSDSVL